MTDWQQISFVIEDYRDIVKFQEAVDLATLLHDFEQAEAEEEAEEEVLAEKIKRQTSGCLKLSIDDLRQQLFSTDASYPGNHLITFYYARR